MRNLRIKTENRALFRSEMRNLRIHLIKDMVEYCAFFLVKLHISLSSMRNFYILKISGTTTGYLSMMQVFPHRTIFFFIKSCVFDITTFYYQSAQLAVRSRV